MFQIGCYENRVLRRIFGPKRDEVTGGWRNNNNKNNNNKLFKVSWRLGSIVQSV
jgi:hypothetical protein